MDLGFIVAGIFFMAVIISWIIAIPIEIAHFVAYIICNGKKDCKKDDCYFRGYCNRTALSDKERKLIKKKIESMDDNS